MRVRTNSIYTYQPCGLDRFDARTDLQPGELVRVANLHVCPPANTMGHAHVNRLDGTFAGLVCTASLQRQGVAP